MAPSIRSLVIALLLGAGVAGAALAEAAPQKVVYTEALLFCKGRFAPLCFWTGAAQDPHRSTFEVKTGDGVALRGWAINAPDPKAPFVIDFHGGGSTIGDSVSLAEDAIMSSRLNLNVITFDYRGSGFSEGVLSVPAMFADALVVYDEVSRRAAGRPVYVVGWSMGSIFACHVAANRPSVAGLILLAPIASIATLTQDLRQQGNIDLEVPSSFKAFDNVANLRAFKKPLLVVHGSADMIVPITQGRRDFAAAASPDKKFVTLEGKTHFGAVFSIESDAAVATFVRDHSGPVKPLGSDVPR